MSRSPAAVEPVLTNNETDEHESNSLASEGYAKRLLTRAIEIDDQSPFDRHINLHSPTGDHTGKLLGSSRGTSSKDNLEMAELSRLQAKNSSILNVYIRMHPVTLHFNDDVLERNYRQVSDSKRRFSILAAYVFLIFLTEYACINYFANVDHDRNTIDTLDITILQVLVVLLCFIFLLTSAKVFYYKLVRKIKLTSFTLKFQYTNLHDFLLCASVMIITVCHIRLEIDEHQDVVHIIFILSVAYLTVIIGRMNYIKATVVLSCVYVYLIGIREYFFSLNSVSMVLCNFGIISSLRLAEHNSRRDFRLTRRLAAENIDVKVDVTTQGWFSKGQSKVAPAKPSVWALEDTDQTSTTRSNKIALSHIIRSTEIKVDRTLGAGAFGTVSSGKWRGTDVAVKQIHGAPTQSAIEAFGTESAIMASIRHPSIVMHLGVCLKPLMMVMELMPRGSLYTIIHVKKIPLDWSLRIRMLHDTVLGMTFLHSLDDPIFHNDLKSLNILVDQNWHCKVSDFGQSRMRDAAQQIEAAQGSLLKSQGSEMAKKMSEGSVESPVQGPTEKKDAEEERTGQDKTGDALESIESSSKQEKQRTNSKSFCNIEAKPMATLGWASPEVLCEEPLTGKNDVYAFGVVMYEVLSGITPFAAVPREAIAAAIIDGKRPEDYTAIPNPKNGEVALEGSQLDAFSSLALLMRQCWRQVPEERPDFPQILEMLENARRLYFGEGCQDWDEEVVVPYRTNLQQADTVHDRSQITFDIKPDELQIGPKIGSGAYGQVFEALYHGTHVAVKQLYHTDMPESVLKEFQKECQLMLSFRHPNVVLFLGANSQPPKLLLVTELLTRGSLYYTYTSSSRPSTRQRHMKMLHKITEGMALGLNYLHNRDPPVIHRDMKSPNVLLDEHWNAKIGDFGLSRIKEEGKVMTCVGSPLWAAPEMLRGEMSGCPSDVYSFAIVVWELLVWGEPYPGMSPNAVMRQVAIKGMRPKLPGDCPNTVRELLLKCWESDPNKRPTFDQIIPLVEKWNKLE